MDELMQALADYLLQSGFEDQFTRYQQVGERDQSMEALREAIRKALLNGDLLDEELREQMQQMQAEGKLDELIDQLIERMEQEDYISSRLRTIPRSNRPPAGRSASLRPNRVSKLPTKDSISSATAHCAICWDRSASRTSAATIRATRPRASKPAAPCKHYEFGDTLTSTSPARWPRLFSAKG